MYPRVSPDVIILGENGKPTKHEWDVASSKTKRSKKSEAPASSNASKRKKPVNLNQAFNEPASAKKPKVSGQLQRPAKTLRPLAPKTAADKPSNVEQPSTSELPKPAVPIEPAPIEDEGPDVELFKLLEKIPPVVDLDGAPVLPPPASPEYTPGPTQSSLNPPPIEDRLRAIFE